MSYSPSSLVAYLACPHLSTLELAVAHGDLKRPFRVNRHADLIRTKGAQHEAAYLDHLRDQKRAIVEVKRDNDAWDWGRMARDTVEAVQGDADVVYQATFLDGEWRGMADFAVRQADASYEAVDTKLARHARPAHVLQLCFYTEQLARIQNRWPEAMHVVNGLGERESFRPADFMAYYRYVRSRFLYAVPSRRSISLRMTCASSGAACR